MKIYWMQGGLRAEPETQQERDALLVLSEASVRGKSDEESVRNGTGSAFVCGSLVHGENGSIIDQ
jgi:hypothetical protein